MKPRILPTGDDLKNCEVCGGAYAPYKTGPDEDIGSYASSVPAFNAVPTKGVCQFHNPESKLYNPKQPTQET